MTCDHQYHICSLSDVHVSFKCSLCGKEIVLHLRDGPIDLLKWGYGWYHMYPSEETIELLRYQGISKNNVKIVPQRQVFIVSYIEKMDVLPCRDGKNYNIDFGDICSKGIFFEEEKALEALGGNLAACYSADHAFASLECYVSGLANLDRRISFFKYDSDLRCYKAYEPPIQIKKNIRTVATGLVK